MVEEFHGYITVSSRPLLVSGGLMWFLRCVFTGTSRSLHGPGFPINEQFTAIKLS